METVGAGSKTMSEPEQRGRTQPEADPTRGPFERDVQWPAGLVGGLAGGVAMGLVMQLPMGVMALVGAMVGVQSAVAGWALHLTVSALYGLIFAWTVSMPFVRDEFVDSLGGSALVGVTYGGLLIVVSGGVFLTLIAEALNVTEQPFPLIPAPGTAEGIWLAIWGGLAHLLYGLVLGAVYAVWRGSGFEWPASAEH